MAGYQPAEEIVAHQPGAVQICMVAAQQPVEEIERAPAQQPAEEIERAPAICMVAAQEILFVEHACLALTALQTAVPLAVCVLLMIAETVSIVLRLDKADKISPRNHHRKHQGNDLRSGQRNDRKHQKLALVDVEASNSDR